MRQQMKTSSIPDVSNKDIYTAINTLFGSELDYEVVGVGNTVTSQYPKAGETAVKGAKIKIYVETQDTKNVLAVPNIMGMTIEEAKAALGEDFVLQGSGSGKITSQIPRSGTKIEKNSQVIVKTTE